MSVSGSVSPSFILRLIFGKQVCGNLMPNIDVQAGAEMAYRIGEVRPGAYKQPSSFAILLSDNLLVMDFALLELLTVHGYL